MDPHPVLDVIRRRCSTRSYTSDMLDAETVRVLLDAAVRAPTAMHAEPWAFVVVQDIARLHRYSELTKAAWRGRDIGAALLGPGFNVFYGASTLIVVCTKPAGPFAVADGWLAAENIMLAATALGLGSCCIGSAVEVLSEAAVREELGIPADYSVVAPIIVGRTADACEPASRKPVDILAWMTPEAEGGTS